MTEQQVVTNPAQPETPQTPQVEDYWGVDERDRFYFPDGVQYFEYQLMNEGAKARFQRMTNQDLIVNKDQSARVKMDPAKERHELIKASVVDWYFFKGGNPIPFNNNKLEEWLSKAPPKIVEDLEYKIRLANPWMQADMEPDEIREEIDRLEKLLAEVLERKAGEGSSTSK